MQVRGAVMDVLLGASPAAAAEGQVPAAGAPAGDFLSTLLPMLVIGTPGAVQNPPLQNPLLQNQPLQNPPPQTPVEQPAAELPSGDATPAEQDAESDAPAYVDPLLALLAAGALMPGQAPAPAAPAPAPIVSSAPEPGAMRDASARPVGPVATAPPELTLTAEAAQVAEPAPAPRRATGFADAAPQLESAPIETAPSAPRAAAPAARPAPPSARRETRDGLPVAAAAAVVGTPLADGEPPLGEPAIVAGIPASIRISPAPSRISHAMDAARRPVDASVALVAPVPGPAPAPGDAAPGAGAPGTAVSYVVGTADATASRTDADAQGEPRGRDRSTQDERAPALPSGAAPIGAVLLPPAPAASTATPVAAPSATAAREPVPAPVPEQVVGAARFLVSEGMAALEMRLEPPALGRIRLTTVLERGQLTLTIAPDSLAAHEVLRAAAPDIEALLAARGLTATVSLTAPDAEPADRRPGGRRDGERGARRDPDHSAGSRRREGQRPRLAFVDLVA